MHVFIRLYKESISKEMNTDSDLNLHIMTKLSGWLHYCDTSDITEVAIKMGFLVPFGRILNINGHLCSYSEHLFKPYTHFLKDK